MNDRIEMRHKDAEESIFVYPYQVEQMQSNGWEEVKPLEEDEE